LQNPIAFDSGNEGFDTAQIKANVARALLAALTNECTAYCVLSGYDHLPDSFDTDIDFMVNGDDFERMPQIIQRVACKTNTKLFHTVGHELSARSYSLGFQAGERLIIVQPDATADYRHFGLLWLRADEVLAARRRHASGIWIPAARHEFAYYLIKRMNKRDIEARHGLKLHRLYLEDPAGCDKMIARFWKGEDQTSLSRMASTNDWIKTRGDLESIRTEMIRNSEETPAKRIASIPGHVIHHLLRLLIPTGGWIAIIGPDGAGKSAVIDAICEQFRFAFHRVNRFHLRPKSLRRESGAQRVVTDPHGKPPRGIFLSVLKVLFLMADYWLGYALRIAPAMRRSQLIVFDRYVYDLLVDSKRVRYGGPVWLLRLAARLVPHPNMVILLDAPPEVLWARKREVPFDEVVRQRGEYCKQARMLSFAKVVNAAQPFADVIRDVDCTIVDYFEQRTAERLRLGVLVTRSDHTAIEAPRPQC
jgi:thymidylate kinase